MQNYTPLFFKSFIIEYIGGIGFIVLAIIMFRGCNAFVKEVIKGKYSKKIVLALMKYIVPIFIIYFSISTNYNSTADFILKDYIESQGTMTFLSKFNNKSLYVGVSFDEKGYRLPKKLYVEGVFKPGKKYKFLYAKRSKMILRIQAIQ